MRRMGRKDSGGDVEEFGGTQIFVRPHVLPDPFVGTCEPCALRSSFAVRHKYVCLAPCRPAPGYLSVPVVDLFLCHYYLYDPHGFKIVYYRYYCGNNIIRPIRFSSRNYRQDPPLKSIWYVTLLLSSLWCRWLCTMMTTAVFAIFFSRYFLPTLC